MKTKRMEIGHETDAGSVSSEPAGFEPEEMKQAVIADTNVVQTGIERANAEQADIRQPNAEQADIELPIFANSLSANCYQVFFEALARGGMENIAEAASRLLDLPVVIISAEYAVLGQFPKRWIGDLIWDTMVQEHKVPNEMIWQFKNDLYIKEVNGHEEPMFVDWGMVRNLPRIMGNFKVNGVIEGYIGILFPETTPSAEVSLTEASLAKASPAAACRLSGRARCTEAHLEAARLLCRTISLELSKRNNLQSSRRALQSAFLLELFQGGIRDGQHLEHWLENTGLRLEGRYCIFAAQPDPIFNEFALLKYIRRQLEEAGWNRYAVVLEDTLFILCAALPAQAGEDGVYERLLQDHGEMFERYDLRFGASAVFARLEDVPVYRYQACQALQACLSADGDSGSLPAGKGRNRTAHPKPAGVPERPHVRYLPYRRVMLRHLLEIPAMQLHPLNFLHPGIALLRDFDRENHTEYLRTLRRHVLGFCDSGRTTAELGIHRNTLLYRLQKIRQIGGIDLADVDACALLLCNFLAYPG